MPRAANSTTAVKAGPISRFDSTRNSAIGPSTSAVIRGCPSPSTTTTRCVRSSIPKARTAASSAVTRSANDPVPALASPVRDMISPFFSSVFARAAASGSLPHTSAPYLGGRHPALPGWCDRPPSWLSDHTVFVRLFVAAWPPEQVVVRLGALVRPPLAGLRWTRSEQLHVTLEFLGDVARSAVGPLTAALATWAEGADPTHAFAGSNTELLGNRVLCLPVSGLDALAAGIRATTTGFGSVRDDRPFAGHLTLARTRGRQRLPAGLTGGAVSCDWWVDEVRLVASVLGSEGPRYDPVTHIPVG